MISCDTAPFALPDGPAGERVLKEARAIVAVEVAPPLPRARAAAPGGIKSPISSQSSIMASMRYPIITIVIAFAAMVPATKADSSWLWARYQVVSVTEVKESQQNPPVSDVTLVAGPGESSRGVEYIWWELQVKKRSGDRFAFRVLSEHVPMTEAGKHSAPGKIVRYILKEGDDPPVEYVHAVTGLAYLPKFDFTGSMCPVSGEFTSWHNGFATVGTYLGHLLTLVDTGDTREWDSWNEPLELRLNTDVFIYRYGMSKDTDDRYITTFPHGDDYTYVPLTREDVEELISLGLNGFNVSDQQEEWVRFKPVFYYKATAYATVGIQYPETLYRSNYRGATDFIDEPAHHMAQALKAMRRPEQAATLMVQHLKDNWNRSSGSRHWTGLSDHLRTRGVNLGNFKIIDDDYPIWETVPETGFYQLMGGPKGILHEGRWQLHETNSRITRLLGSDVNITVDEMLKLYYADLRGAARACGGSWGTSIYGQCDPEVAPRALTLAYDMGARYLWFWTFDKHHHLPYFMTKNLLKHLQEHMKAHPRPPREEILYAPRTVIVMPYGYQAVKRSSDTLWGGIHMNSRNTEGVPHSDVVCAAIGEAIAAMRAGEDFDFAIDTGQCYEGYNRVVTIGLDALVHDSLQETGTARLKAKSFGHSRLEPDTFRNIKPLMRIPHRADIDIDGSLDEWEDARWLTLNNRSQYTPCPVLPENARPWGGIQDLSAEVTFARDENYLYMVAKVIDDHFDQGRTEGSIWQGDSIELALDTECHHKQDIEGSEPLWKDIFGGMTGIPHYAELAIARTPNGPQVFLGRCPRGMIQRIIGNAKLAVIHGGDSHTFYEAAIPWNAVSPFPPHFTRYAKLSFMVNDNDGSNRKGFLALTPGIGTAKDPSQFALVEFEPVPAGDPIAVTSKRGPIKKSESLRMSIDSILDTQRSAYLVVDYDRAGHTAASGRFDVDITEGRTRFTIEIDISGMKPGVYACSAYLKDSGDDTQLAKSSFQVIITE